MDFCTIPLLEITFNVILGRNSLKKKLSVQKKKKSLSIKRDNKTFLLQNTYITKIFVSLLCDQAKNKSIYHLRILQKTMFACKLLQHPHQLTFSPYRKMLDFHKDIQNAYNQVSVLYKTKGQISTDTLHTRWDFFNVFQ